MTVEDCLALDVSILKGRFKLDRPVRGTYRWPRANDADPAIDYRVVHVSANGRALGLRYFIGTSRTPVEYTVQTTTTPCNFGRLRYWFVCPLVRNGIPCLKRAKKLYLAPGARYFGCRTCYDLTYRSAQQHDKHVDALLRLPAEELRKVLLQDATNLGTLTDRCKATVVRRFLKRG